QQATILGDDGVEHPVQVGAGIAKIGQHAPGHEQKSPARFSDARQRGRRRRTDLAVLSDGAVVIDGERVDDHTVKSLPSRYHRAASGTRIRSHATIIELATSSLFNRLPSRVLTTPARAEGFVTLDR